jgi:PIN domain nuclease of toxin-antitoxin system
MDQSTRQAVAAPEIGVFVSTASVWKIAIAPAAGRPIFPIEQFDDIARREGFDVLTVRPVHAILAASSQRHRADPFDRMPIAQSTIENLILVSGDSAIAR